MTDKTQVFNRDCLEAMREFPDKYFELAIVDPPYGIGFDGHSQINGKSGKSKNFKSKTLYAKKEWDSKRPSNEYFNELIRVSEHQIIWGGNYFTDLLSVTNGWIYWDKKVTPEENTTFSDGELAWTSISKPLKKFTYGWTGFSLLNNPDYNGKIHPTQKPVALYKWLLKNYANVGDKILDTHLGSGSSRIAAFDMGFEFYGYELDKEYFDASCKRFEQHKAQLTLF
jgi:site-specific DNA-methyltransferase (adenine-specific)